jgi:hypothetical protein
MTIREWLDKHSEKYEDKQKAIQACAKRLKIDYKSVRDFVTRHPEYNRWAPVRPVGSSTIRGKGSKQSSASRKRRVGKKARLDGAMKVDDFLQPFDYMEQVRQGLDDLGERVIKDHDFRSALGLSTKKWKEVLDSGEFDANRIHIRDKGRKYHIWGNKDILRSIKERL